jgi:hypothetical protein
VIIFLYCLLTNNNKMGSRFSASKNWLSILHPRVHLATYTSIRAAVLTFTRYTMHTFCHSLLVSLHKWPTDFPHTLFSTIIQVLFYSFDNFIRSFPIYLKHFLPSPSFATSSAVYSLYMLSLQHLSISRTIWRRIVGWFIKNKWQRI